MIIPIIVGALKHYANSCAHLSNSQLGAISDTLVKIFCPREERMKWFTSCMDVLVPEVAIRLIMQTYDIDYRQAAERMNEEPPTRSPIVIDDSGEESDIEAEPRPKARKRQEGSEQDDLAIGRVLALKKKREQGRAKNKGKKKGTAADIHKATLMINACTMKPYGPGYVQSSNLVELEVKKDLSYHQLATFAATSLGLTKAAESGSATLALFRPSIGSVIINEKLNVKGVLKPWSITSYVEKQHRRSDEMKFGVEYANALLTVGCVQSGSGSQTHTGSDSSKVASKETFSINVWYAPKGGDVVEERSRSAVWQVISSEQEFSQMDLRECVFLPEEHGWEIVRIQKKERNALIPLLEPRGDEVTPSVSAATTNGAVIVYQSEEKTIVSTVKSATPLCCIVKDHHHSDYEWMNMDDRSQQYPSTPVLWVQQGTFQCTVSMGTGQKMTSKIFSVVCNPVPHVGTSGVTTGARGAQGQDYSEQGSSCGLPAMEFTYAELVTATNHFSPDVLLGCGGFGKVYLAKNLRSLGTNAAVKVLSKDGEKAVVSKCSQLETEVKALTRYRHPHLLDLMGVCKHDTSTALVYEYMDGKSLFFNLHESKDTLTWDQRENILKGTCSALAYLHSSTPPLIHQDVKSQNILLDKSKGRVKLGDFGFALQMPNEMSGRTHMTAPMMARTAGYTPPELMSCQISPKSDVYSYGMVVLETFTGQKAFDKSRAEDVELACYCEDAIRGEHATVDKFRALADPAAVPSPDLRLVTLTWNIAKVAVVRHSARATSEKVMKFWTEYDD